MKVLIPIAVCSWHSWSHDWIIRNNFDPIAWVPFKWTRFWCSENTYSKVGVFLKHTHFQHMSHFLPFINKDVFFACECCGLSTSSRCFWLVVVWPTLQMLPAPSKELSLVQSMGVFGKVLVSNVDHKGLEMIQIRVWRLVQDFFHQVYGYCVADVWCLKICIQNKPVQQCSAILVCSFLVGWLDI